MKLTVMAILLFSASIIVAKSPEAKPKKVKTFTVSKELDLPADKVWAVVGEDYGSIALSHPAIIHSEYVGVSIQGQHLPQGPNQSDRGAVFVRMDQRIALEDDEVSDKSNLLLRQMDDQIAAGVRRAEAQEIHTQALDIQGAVGG